MFLILLYIVLFVLIFSSIGSIVYFLRFQERDAKLPEACKYIDLAEKNQILQKNNDGLISANENLQSENAVLNQYYTEAMEKKEWLEQNRTLLFTIEEDRRKQEELKAEYQGYLERLPLLQEQEQKLIQHESQLAAVQENLAAKYNEMQEIAEKTEALQKEKSELDEEISRLSNNQQLLTNDTQTLQHALESLSQQKSELDGKIKELLDQEHEYQTKTVTLAAQILANESACESLTSEKNKLTEKTEALKAEKLDLEIRQASLMKENEGLTVENEAAVRKLRELQDTVGAEADKLENITADYNQKKMELASYQTQKDTLLKEIDILKESLDAMRKEAGVSAPNRDTLNDLWEPVIYPDLPPAKKAESESRLLTDTKNYIRGRKLYFPDRVLYAFHTAMKCNDISPLTVLAGISGTGKSELPKCYAEGMGIHFTMLSVQPRWDSPQDLLGFYNYMENKYKATELARALVRFERFNRSSWGDIPAECDDRSDRMLLVLLDEMNLARIEYYFSEFLSKLEIRRSVDYDNPQDRAKAEIELELSGHTPLRLFPDRNILFTGTMNEDESTLALSDKVLDRANVLRFGKPKSADISSKIQNPPKKAANPCGLTYARWHSWCTDIKSVQMDKQVSAWINQLNDAMELLQKPFGHRVAQAIAAYIANYPKDLISGDEKKIAFADQIEQRIMPKLRGIDLEQYEEPLKKIGELIVQTDDDKLRVAYEHSCKDTVNGIFLWQGVDRSEDI